PKQFDDGAITPSATSSYKANSGSYNGHPGNRLDAATNPVRFNGVFSRTNRGAPYGLRDLTDGTTNTIAIAEVKWGMDGNRRNRGRIHAAQDIIDYAQGASNCLFVQGEWAMNWT